MNKPHKNLDVWTSAMDLTQHIYQVTDRFPIKEQYGLSNQIKRAAVSITSNIARGSCAAQQERVYSVSLYRQGLTQ